MEESNIIFGIHSIVEALRQDKDIEKIILLRDSDNPKLKEIEGLAKQNTIKVSYVPIQKFRKYEQFNHQGAIAHTSKISYSDFETTVEKGFRSQRETFILTVRWYYRCKKLRSHFKNGRMYWCRCRHSTQERERSSKQRNHKNICWSSLQYLDMQSRPS